jgi:hypothetical protein
LRPAERGRVSLSIELLKVRVSEREAEFALDKLLLQGLMAKIAALATPPAQNLMGSQQRMTLAMQGQPKYDGTKSP